MKIGPENPTDEPLLGGAMAEESESALSRIAGQVWYGITKIPICGGYLAETNSNEDSCFRAFSNEETVPQPCLKHRVPRAVFEHNLLVRTFGRVGFEACDRQRKPIFVAAFALSMLGWVFSIAAAFAYTLDEQTVRNVAWGVGDVADGSLAYFVGLQELVVDDLNGGHGGDGTRSSSMAWVGESACKNPVTFRANSLGGQLVTAHDGIMPHCRSCRDVAVYTCVKLVILSCVTQVFQITTDLQRTTRYGDLNCQKLFGCVTSVYGLVSTIETMQVFRLFCGLKATFPPWELTTALNVTLTDTGAPALIHVTMKAGPGFVLLWLAVLFKFFDALAHLVVPTPRERHAPMPNSSAGAGHPWRDLSAYMGEAKPFEGLRRRDVSPAPSPREDSETSWAQTAQPAASVTTSPLAGGLSGGRSGSDAGGPKPATSKPLHLGGSSTDGSMHSTWSKQGYAAPAPAQDSANSDDGAGAAASGAAPVGASRYSSVGEAV